MDFEPINDEATYILPTLYHTDKRGKRRMWRTWVTGDTLYKCYGEVGGKLITNGRIFKGVNIGRSNETTAEEQAKLQADRSWAKQCDKDYAPEDEEGMAASSRLKALKSRQQGTNINAHVAIRGEPQEEVNSEKDEISNGTIPGYTSDIKPMHCQKWTEESKVLKHYNDFEEGAYIQPKLDGVRALARIVFYKGERLVSLTSRDGNQFVWLTHLKEEISLFLEGYENVILDGEIYANHIYGEEVVVKRKRTYIDSEAELPVSQRFDVISGAARPTRNEPHPLEGQLSLHVFDVILLDDMKADQDTRFEVLKTLFKREMLTPRIELVSTTFIEFPEEIKDHQDEMTKLDYEGVVVRARDLIYEPGRRSLKIRKYKEFMDDEFAITGAECDEGVDEEHFRWICEMNENGKTFSVKPMGTREHRLEMYQDREAYYGKMLTVRYQQLTNEGLPRFGRGVSIRDYE